MAGSNAISANYTGDTMFGPSTSAVLSQMVNQASTTVTLTSSSNPSGTGQPVTFTGSVTPNHPGERVILQQETPAGDWRDRLIKVLWSYTLVLLDQPGLAQSAYWWSSALPYSSR